MQWLKGEGCLLCKGGPVSCSSPVNCLRCLHVHACTWCLTVQLNIICLKFKKYFSFKVNVLLFWYVDVNNKILKIKINYFNIFARKNNLRYRTIFCIFAYHLNEKIRWKNTVEISFQFHQLKMGLRWRTDKDYKDQLRPKVNS